jgi:glycosyltransferase involved in cell wall biosynthesis
VRIALLARRIAPEGGMEAHAAWLARTLSARGHDITVVTASGDAVIDTESPTAATVRIAASTDAWSKAWYRGAADAVQAIAPELVVAESTSAGPLVDRWPTVTHLHGNHWNELASAWAVWGRRRTRRALRRTAFLAADYARWRPRQIARGGVIALTEREATLARCLYGVPRRRLAVIGNPVSDRFLSARARPTRRIVFAGRLDPSKGPELLPAAFAGSRARRSGYTLEFAGDGPLRRPLADQCARLGISRDVRFHGRLARDELAELVSGASIACFPSVGPESFSLALIEAMGAGCAVVCSERAGLSEVVRHPMAAKTSTPVGKVVRERSAAAWRAALDSLSADDDALARQSVAARALAGAFGEQRVAGAIEAFYADRLAAGEGC